MKKFSSIAFGLMLIAGVALADNPNNPTPTSGTISFSGTINSYVELTDGEDDPLAAEVDFGAVDPEGNNGDSDDFSEASVGIQLRSNVDYALSASGATLLPASGTDIALSNVGFGIDNVDRLGFGLDAGGADANGTGGDPEGADANPLTAAHDFGDGVVGTVDDLADIGSGSTVLSGDRINSIAPRSVAEALSANVMLAVRRQFYAPGSFSGSITLTLAAD